MGRTRRFFEAAGYTEVFPPSLVPAGAFEASIDCLEVTARGHRWQLPSSPEMEMKHALAQAPLPIFSIVRAYRDDPETNIHEREFQMLEYYRVGDVYAGVVDETCRFIEAMNASAGAPSLAWKRLSLKDWFAERGLILEQLDDLPAFAQAVRQTGLAQPQTGDSWSDIFFRVFLEHGERTLDPVTPTVVEDYPTRLSPLSQPHPEQPFYARRFEIYWQGMEICNGCEELLEPAALEASWERQNLERIQRGQQPHPRPTRLLEAAPRLPRSSGVAIGLERLFLAVSRQAGDSGPYRLDALTGIQPLTPRP